MAEWLVACGDAPPPRALPAGTHSLRLRLDGPDRNVDLRLEDLTRRLAANVPTVLTDLLEVAALVFAADEMASRGGPTMAALGRDWRHRFRFVVPVREPDRWSAPDVLHGLCEALGFMSEHEFEFEFTQRSSPPKLASYLDLGATKGRKFTTDEVLLFSGGMDSLCGALSELAQPGKRLLLLSHQSSTKMAQRQRHLAAQLQRRFPERVLHVPVRAGVAGQHPQEFTQRTRSFLFAAIAVAASAGCARIRFYENGVVSLNLPISGHVIGARASRTTHPKTLWLLERLLGLLLGRKFSVENPFVWKTRAEVARTAVECGHPELLAESVSCSRVRSMTTEQPHCGVCSQCIDRRIATLAANLADWDPQGGYRVDLLAGARERSEDRAMAEGYVRHAIDIRGMSQLAFMSRFANEIARATAAFPGLAADEVARRVLDMHERHAKGVVRVLASGVGQHAQALVEGGLPSSCLLRLAVNEHREAIKLPEPQTESRCVRPWGAELPGKLPTLDIEMALPEGGNDVEFPGVGHISSGASRRLIDVLAERHQADLAARRPAEECRFLQAEELAPLLGIEQETLRRRISSFRRKVTALYEEQAELSLSADAVIENKEWRGYRLNPRVRVVGTTRATPAPSQLSSQGLTSFSDTPRKSGP